MSRASWSKLGGGRLRRDCPEMETGAGKGRGVLLDCACTRKPDCEEARLLAGLPEVLLPERSVKCFLFYLRGSQHSSVQHLTSSCEGFEV